MTVLPASKALDTNVFAVTKSTASKDHLTTISSLKPYASKLTLGGPPECPTFAGCEPGLKKIYGLNFAGFKSLDEAGPLSVAALKNGEVQVVELFSSDGNVVSQQLRGAHRQQAPRGRRLHRPGHPEVGGHLGRGERAQRASTPS